MQLMQLLGEFVDLQELLFRIFPFDRLAAVDINHRHSFRRFDHQICPGL